MAFVFYKRRQGEPSQSLSQFDKIFETTEDEDEDQDEDQDQDEDEDEDEEEAIGSTKFSNWIQI